ncbi:MAG TPA: hypothetical protein PLB21_14790 [Actinomycetota bacterium]|nr:hypothetical protein [Actinomycetota bacterium]
MAGAVTSPRAPTRDGGTGPVGVLGVGLAGGFGAAGFGGGVVVVGLAAGEVVRVATVSWSGRAAGPVADGDGAGGGVAAEADVSGAKISAAAAVSPRTGDIRRSWVRSR